MTAFSSIVQNGILRTALSTAEGLALRQSNIVEKVANFSLPLLKPAAAYSCAVELADGVVQLGLNYTLPPKTQGRSYSSQIRDKAILVNDQLNSYLIRPVLHVGVALVARKYFPGQIPLYYPLYMVGREFLDRYNETPLLAIIVAATFIGVLANSIFHQNLSALARQETWTHAVAREFVYQGVAATCFTALKGLESILIDNKDERDGLVLSLISKVMGFAAIFYLNKQLNAKFQLGSPPFNNPGVSSGIGALVEAAKLKCFG